MMQWTGHGVQREASLSVAQRHMSTAVFNRDCLFQVLVARGHASSLLHRLLLEVDHGVCRVVRRANRLVKVSGRMAHRALDESNG